MFVSPPLPPRAPFPREPLPEPLPLPLSRRSAPLNDEDPGRHFFGLNVLNTFFCSPPRSSRLRFHDVFVGASCFCLILIVSASAAQSSCFFMLVANRAVAEFPGGDLDWGPRAALASPAEAGAPLAIELNAGRDVSFRHNCASQICNIPYSHCPSRPGINLNGDAGHDIGGLKRRVDVLKRVERLLESDISVLLEQKL